MSEVILSEQRVVNFLMDSKTAIICASNDADRKNIFYCHIEEHKKLDASCFQLITDSEIDGLSDKNEIWLAEVSTNGEPFFVGGHCALSPMLIMDEVRAIQMDLTIMDDGNNLFLAEPDGISDNKKDILILNTIGGIWKVIGKNSELRSFPSPVPTLEKILKNELNLRVIDDVKGIIRERSILVFGSPMSVNDTIEKFLSDCKTEWFRDLNEFQIMVLGDERDVAVGILNELKFDVIEAERVQYSILLGLAKALIVKKTMSMESTE